MAFTQDLEVLNGHASFNIEAEPDETLVVAFVAPSGRDVSTPTCTMAPVSLSDVDEEFVLASVAPVVTDNNASTVTLTWSTTKLGLIAANFARRQVAFRVLDDDDELLVEGTVTVLRAGIRSEMQRPDPVVTVTVESA